MLRKIQIKGWFNLFFYRLFPAFDQMWDETDLDRVIHLVYA